MKRVLFFAALFGLIACERDDNRLARLEAQRDSVCAEAVRDSVDVFAFLEPATTKDSARFQARRDSIDRHLPVDTLGGQWGKSRIACDLAIREYNRFMR